MRRNRNGQTTDGPETSRSRRGLLASLGAGVAALAGCSGGNGGDDQDTTDNTSEIPPDYPSALVLDGVALSSGFPVTLLDPETGTELADVQYHPEMAFQHWHRLPVEIPVGEPTRIAVRVVGHDGRQIPLGTDGKLRVELEPTEETSPSLLDVEVSGAQIRLRGSELDTGSYRLRLVRNEEESWSSPPLDIRLTG